MFPLYKNPNRFHYIHLVLCILLCRVNKYGCQGCKLISRLVYQTLPSSIAIIRIIRFNNYFCCCSFTRYDQSAVTRVPPAAWPAHGCPQLLHERAVCGRSRTGPQWQQPARQVLRQRCAEAADAQHAAATRTGPKGVNCGRDRATPADGHTLDEHFGDDCRPTTMNVSVLADGFI